jgi:hypothetical protein
MEFSVVFGKLKSILQPYESKLDCKLDIPGDYYLNTKHIMKNKKPLYFGSVKINKSYVSYHLMPVYVQPYLLNKISGNLKKRMHGKSCFNFNSIDDDLIAELCELTLAGYKYYNNEGYVK